mgnify:FL=1|tara:strand:- start:186 stop:362 length:177 start_codon:yes stop_codon:yes gene_type:complete
MLSRKYYKLIAQCIKDSTIINRRDITYIDKDLLINDLSIEFKKDNNLFNREIFVEHCE